MDMPAAEFVEWQAYFSIHPFSFQAIEYQNAKLLHFIFNTAGKSFRPQRDFSIYLPSFMKEEKEIIFVPKSLEQQRNEFSSFMSKLKNANNGKL